jgi:parvulin-like peptidyl-prolyl isomerase
MVIFAIAFSGRNAETAPWSMPPVKSHERGPVKVFTSARRILGEVGRVNDCAALPRVVCAPSAARSRLSAALSRRVVDSRTIAASRDGTTDNRQRAAEGAQTTRQRRRQRAAEGHAGDILRKDIVIAIAGIAIVAAICFGLAFMKPDFKPFSSHPAPSVMATVEGGPEHVIMHVNGEAITESEFQAAYSQLPEDMQRQFANEAGKQAFAEQMVRLKLLEQEGLKAGVQKDPHVAGQLAADHTNIIASAMAQKLVPQPSPAAVQKFYNENKQNFEATELSHILIAYQGSTVPSRSGKPLSQQEALKKAQSISQQLKAGADFAKLARQYSDDTSSAERGGVLGPFSPGMLPPELEAHIAQLQPGQVSDPIPSRFGVHIFKTGARTSQPLEQVRVGISRRVQQQSTLEKVEQMRKAAKVEFDPKFFPEANAKPPVGKKVP